MHDDDVDDWDDSADDEGVSEEDADRWDAAQDGAELILEERFEEAEARLQALTEDDAQNPYAFFFLGNALFEQEKYVKAMRAYLTALELSPTYLGAMVGIGQTLRLLGRYDEAIRMGRQILARDKTDLDGLFLLGSCHFARGDNDAAATYLERFIACNPELEAATEAQGMLQVIRGEITPAVPDEDEDMN